MNKVNPKWTFKEILKGKTILVVFLYCLVLFGGGKLFQSLLIFLLNINNKYTYRYNISYNVILFYFFLPAFFITMGLIKLYYNRIDPKLPSAIRTKYERDSDSKIIKDLRFKWHYSYTLFLAFLLIIAIVIIAENNSFNKTYQNRIMWISFFLILFILFFGVKRFNRWMMRVTRTNEELINGMRNGYYLSEIPRRYSNAEHIRGIINYLDTGMVHSVKAALIMHVVVLYVKRILKVLGWVGIILFVIITLGMITIVGMFSDSGTSSSPTYIRLQRSDRDAIVDDVVNRLRPLY